MKVDNISVIKNAMVIHHNVKHLSNWHNRKE